jgi:hypothetical protein
MGPSARFACHNWPTISAVARLRLNPCRPVEQNRQAMVQPAWVETQSVPRPASGMKTVSTALPLPTSSSHLRVGGRVVGDHRRGQDLRRRRQHLARAPGEIGHAGEVGLAELVHPAQHLPGPKRLLAAVGEEAAERGGIESEQIDFHPVDRGASPRSAPIVQ